MSIWPVQQSDRSFTEWHREDRVKRKRIELIMVSDEKHVTSPIFHLTYFERDADSNWIWLNTFWCVSFIGHVNYFVHWCIFVLATVTKMKMASILRWVWRGEVRYHRWKFSFAARVNFSTTCNYPQHLFRKVVIRRWIVSICGPFPRWVIPHDDWSLKLSYVSGERSPHQW